MPDNPDEPSLVQQIAKAIEGSPSYLVAWLLGFVVITLSEVTMTALAVAAILFGFLTHNVLLALVVYLFAYVLARVVNNIASSIGQGLSLLSRQVNNSNQILLQFGEANKETDTRANPES